MTTRRPSRLSSQIREEVSQIISRELRDPRIGFVTVTGVELSADLKHARVYFSVLGGEKERRETLEGLNSAAGYVRHKIASRINIKRIPEISFSFDESVSYGDRIQRLLSKLRDQD